MRLVNAMRFTLLFSRRPRPRTRRVIWWTRITIRCRRRRRRPRTAHPPRYTVLGNTNASNQYTGYFVSSHYTVNHHCNVSSARHPNMQSPMPGPSGMNQPSNIRSPQQVCYSQTIAWTRTFLFIMFKVQFGSLCGFAYSKTVNSVILWFTTISN